MANVSSGSYDFEALKDSAYQLERLRQQALAVRQLEAGILKSAGLQLDHDVVEIGSGPGFVTDLLGELAANGSVHAVEPNERLLNQVAANVDHKPARGLFCHQAFGDKLPLSEACIDFSYARFVLQHVPRPAGVIAEVHRVLRPGGKVCLVDSDDGLVLMHPRESRVDSLLQTAQGVQAEQGGDRYVGRKLQGMLLDAGFVKVKSHILALTSTELPFSVLFNILLGYKASLLGDAFDMKALFDDLSADVSAGRRLIAAGVFVVSGEKA